MNEMTVTRGRDIEVYLDGDLLYGLTHLRAKSRYRRRELYEYLSGEPWGCVPDGESHEIELKVLSLFGGEIPMGESFSLCIVDGDDEYVYDGCTVAQCDKDIRGDKNVTDSYLIRAGKMTKRRNV